MNKNNIFKHWFFYLHILYTFIYTYICLFLFLSIILQADITTSLKNNFIKGDEIATSNKKCSKIKFKNQICLKIKNSPLIFSPLIVAFIVYKNISTIIAM